VFVKGNAQYGGYTYSQKGEDGPRDRCLLRGPWPDRPMHYGQKENGPNQVTSLKTSGVKVRSATSVTN